MKRWNIVGCSSVRSRDASRRLGRARGNAKPNPDDSILRSTTYAIECEALNLSRASIRYYHRSEGDRAGNVGPGRRILRTLGATLFTREVYLGLPVPCFEFCPEAQRGDQGRFDF